MTPYSVLNPTFWAVTLGSALSGSGIVDPNFAALKVAETDRVVLGVFHVVCVFVHFYR